MIKPIETIYNGYRFRSRLEARWAVFFDSIGIRYEYEPEGFVGCYGEYYLPDFYLPDHDVYVEVKGSDEQLKNDAHKIEGAIDFLATPISTAGLVLLGPIPYKEDCIPYFDLLFWHKGVCSTKCLFDINGSFLHDSYYCEKGRSEYWYAYQIYEGIDCGSPLPSSVSVNAKYQEYLATALYMKRPFQEINKAYAKARQARFEHGETPTAPTKTNNVTKCPLHEYVFTCEGCKHEHNQQCDYGVEIRWNGDSVIGLYPDYQA